MKTTNGKNRNQFHYRGIFDQLMWFTDELKVYEITNTMNILPLGKCPTIF